jgi:hypothetical protein
VASDEQRKLQKEIYEYGEVEREASRTADFMPQGGWMYRVMRWVERTARQEREALRDELREMQQEQRKHD